jgi:hypothetical protein
MSSIDMRLDASGGMRLGATRFADRHGSPRIEAAQRPPTATVEPGSGPTARLSGRGRPLALMVIAAVIATTVLAVHGSQVRTGAGTRAAAGDGAAGAPGATHARSRADLASLPLAAQAPVSAALGADQAGYRIEALGARNAAQRLSVKFSASGAAIVAGSARFTLALTAFGRAGALRTLAPVSSVETANRVTYQHRAVREVWTNGPLGLEQTFVVARRPAGVGALSLAVAVPAGSRMAGQSILLPGGLRYGGLRAVDARGRVLPSSMTLVGGRVVLSVDDRGAAYPVTVDPFVQQATLSASDAAAGQFFGDAVAVSGNTIVVGADDNPNINPEDGSASNAGAAYVFTDGSQGWTQTAKLTGNDPEGAFGSSVAISGNTIVVGAPAPISITYGCNAPAPYNDPGSAYIFTLGAGGWTQASELSGGLCGGGGFGFAVAVSGSTVAVSAPQQPFSPSGNEAPAGDGEVDLFQEPSTGWPATDTPSTVLTSSDPQNKLGAGAFDVNLGWSVAISGNTVVAGEPHQFCGGGYNCPGAAYVFTMPTGGWPAAMTQTAELTNTSNSGYDDLGDSVAIDGTTIVVGAPYHGSSQSGALDVYTEPAGGWVNATETAELTSSDAATYGLGWSVAIDGDTIVGGTYPGTSKADVFTMPAGGWATMTQSQELSDAGGDFFGAAVGVSGTTIAVGAPDGPTQQEIGAVDVYGPSAGPPTASITTPASGASYTYGSVPASSFSCADGNGGPGISSCTATIDGGASFTSGAPLLGTVGPHTITVTAVSSDGQSKTATATYTVTQAATNLTASPQLVIGGSGGVGIGTVSATLSSGGQPLAGQTVTFTAGKTTLCTAQTSATGVAACTKLGLAKELDILFSKDSYTASFAATSDYTGSSGSSKAIELPSGLAGQLRIKRPRHPTARGGTRSP